MFPFLNLPPEIRKMVYDICLAQKTMSIHGVCLHMKPENPFLALDLRSTWEGTIPTRTIKILQWDTVRMTYQVERSQFGNDLVPNLFFANRQICDESRATFYSQNQFHFPGVYFSILTCVGFLSDRPASARGHIRSIAIDVCAMSIPTLVDHWTDFCDKLDDLPGLRELKINLDTKIDFFEGFLTLVIERIDCWFFIRHFVRKIDRLMPLCISPTEKGLTISLKLEGRFRMGELRSVFDFEKSIFEMERLSPGWFFRTNFCDLLVRLEDYRELNEELAL